MLIFQRAYGINKKKYTKADLQLSISYQHPLSIYIVQQIKWTIYYKHNISKPDHLH